LAINQPDGSLAFWTSMIPFTSPVVMMARIPFGVPAWQIALSMGFLVLGFIGTTWLAARIYRWDFDVRQKGELQRAVKMDFL
jgi:ABC-2 type transport system permease protein